MGTKIEWCDETVNPFQVKGGGWHCTKVSAGCKNCYAERLNGRFGNKLPYDDRKAEYVFNTKALDKVKRWKKPRRIFWQSMGDVFLPEIALSPFCKCEPPCGEDEAQSNHDSMLKILLRFIYHLETSHTHIILTKRPEVALEFYQRWSYLWEHIPNLHLGVSIENQATADERISILLQIPAVRFISAEPLLGPVRIPLAMCEKCQGLIWVDGLSCPNCGQPCLGIRINGVIVGGESGPGARLMSPDWVRKIRDDCKAAGVPFFFKQWGPFTPFKAGHSPKCKCGKLIKKYHGYSSLVPGDVYTWCKKRGKYIDYFDMRTAIDFKLKYPDFEHDGYLMYRVDKKAAGNLLDGRQHEELPEVRI